MLRASVLFVALFGLATAGEIPMRWYKHIAEHKLKASCWGEDNMEKFYLQLHEASEKCMQLRPVFDIDLFDNENQGFNSLAGFDDDDDNFVRRPNQAQLGQLLASVFEKYQSEVNFRGKRAAGLIETTEEDKREFKANFADLKMTMKDNIGNLTCVLARLGSLDADLNVNLEFFTRDVWRGISGVPSDLKEKAIESYEDCYSLSQAFPSAILNKTPLTRKFGRQMIFFKCTSKKEMKMCALNEINKGLTKWYGDKINDPVELAKLGLPTDRLKATYVISKVLERSKNEQEEFIGKFFSFHKE